MAVIKINIEQKVVDGLRKMGCSEEEIVYYLHDITSKVLLTEIRKFIGVVEPESITFVSEENEYEKNNYPTPME